MLRWTAAASLVGIAWIGCIGDDAVATGAAPAAGDRLGRCLDDGTCHAGFVCHATATICLAPGEDPPAQSNDPSSPAESDASNVDAASNRPDGSSSVPDSGASGCIIEAAPEPGPRCGSTWCPADQACCSNGSEAPYCNEYLACIVNGKRTFQCDGPKSCGSRQICCLKAKTATPTLCSRKFAATSSVCRNDDAPCPDGTLRLCQTSSDCVDLGASRCVPSEVEIATGHVAHWGVCSP